MAGQGDSQAPSTSASTSPIVRFYEAPTSSRDFRGRTLSEILAWDDAALDDSEDFMEILFPTVVSTIHPVVDRDTALAFRSRPELRANLRSAFHRMLSLYGFDCSRNLAGTIVLRRMPGYPDEHHAAKAWLSSKNKHHHRIARIIFSLRLLGFEAEARAFCDALRQQDIALRVGPVVLQEWNGPANLDLAHFIDLTGIPPADEHETSGSLGSNVGHTGGQGSNEKNTGNTESTTNPGSTSNQFYAKPYYVPRNPEETTLSYGIEDIINQFIEATNRGIENLPDERAGYTSALPSWNTDNLPQGLHVRPTFGPSIIPSPLAEPGPEWTSLVEVIRRRYSSLVAASYGAVMDECQSSSLRDDVRARAASLGPDGLHGLVCFLNVAPTVTSNDGSESSQSIPTPAIVAQFEVISLPSTIYPPPIKLQGSSIDQIGARASNTTPSIQIRPLESAVTGQMDNFVINPGHAHFLLNGVSVDKSMLAGPLPDFAVIEVDDSVAFWWRNCEACDYKPAILAKNSRKRSFDEANDGGDLSDPLSPGKRQKFIDDFALRIKKLMQSRKAKCSSPPKESWRQKMDQGLRRHRSERGRQINVKGLHRTTDLTDDDVVNGIAAFWIPLVRSGVVFGYGVSGFFSDCRTEETQRERGMTVCGVVQTFVMPLLFTKDKAAIYEKIKRHYLRSRDKTDSPVSNDGKGSTRSKTSPTSKKRTPSPSKNHTTAKGKDKGKADSAASDSETEQAKQGVEIGHLLLAVATKDPVNEKKITVLIRDSCPGFVDPQVIGEAYKGLVTYSGWMGVDKQGNPQPAEPEFVSEVVEDVPHQPVGGGNTCGLYTILNAWAYMLNIPIHTSEAHHRRPRCGTFKDFHKDLREIIDLAMGGFMDSETVQAFMNVYGYSINQDVEHPVPNVRVAQAVRLEHGTLEAEVLKLKEVDSAAMWESS